MAMLINNTLENIIIAGVEAITFHENKNEDSLKGLIDFYYKTNIFISAMSLITMHAWPIILKK